MSHTEAIKRLRADVAAAVIEGYTHIALDVGAVRALLVAGEDILVELVARHCTVGDQLDSMASVTLTDLIEQLEAFGRVRIIERRSPYWVIAEWVRT